VSVYSYPESKVIDEVTFRTTERGTSRAYLHANPAIDAASLQKIIEELRTNGWNCIPYSENGKSLLEVRGFKKPTQVMKELEKNQWVQGESVYTKSDEDHISFTEKFKKRSLQASGWAYSIGDVAFFTYGYKGSSPLDMAAGVFYGFPTLPLIIYGRNDQSEFQIKDVAKQMRDEFKRQNVNLAPDCSLQSIVTDHKKGLINNAADLLRRYPSEFMNLSYAVAGACIMAAGFKHLNRGATAEGIDGYLKHLQKTNPNATREMAHVFARKNNKIENWLNVGVGTFTVGAGLLATSIKEKAHDPDAPEKHGIDALWEKIKQHPLAIAGGGYIVSTLLHAVSTATAMKGMDAKHKKAVPWRALFVASALTAEILVAISSKGHGEGVKSDKSVDHSILALTAELIAKQPAHMQNQLIEHMSHFLGRPDVLAMKNEEAEKLLRAQVEAMRKNPWAICIQDQASPPAFAAAQQPAIASTPQPLPAWQAKVSAESAAGLQPHPSL
jgi:hypothetical protein